MEVGEILQSPASHGPRENSRVRMKVCRVVISMTNGSLCFITQECTVCNHRRDRDAGEAKGEIRGFGALTPPWIELMYCTRVKYDTVSLRVTT